MALSRNIIFFIVATIPILFAAVQPWIWSFYTVCIFAAFFLVFLQKQDGETWIESKVFIFVTGLFFFCNYISMSAASFFYSIFSKSISIEDFVSSEYHSRQHSLMAFYKLFFAQLIFLVDIPAEFDVIFLCF